MDAQFVNYNEPYSPIPQYTKNIEILASPKRKTSVNKFANQNNQLFQSTTQESHWQQMKRFFSHSTSIKKQQLPEQQTQINPYDQFENILNTCIQQLSFDRYDTTATLQALIQLYTYNLQYLKNPQYTQGIENLLNNWAKQLVSIGQKAVAQCLINGILTSDFMSFLFSIDHFLSQAESIEALRKTQAHKDIFKIIRFQFSDWFTILTQTINLEQFLDTINKCKIRFRSDFLRRYMSAIAERCSTYLIQCFLNSSDNLSRDAI